MKRTAFLSILILSLSASLAMAQGQRPPPPPGGGGPMVNEVDLGGAGSTTVVGEIWVDNWFQMHLNGAPLHEDSTPYLTERSFNGERLTFRTDLPATIAFEFRDYMADDTGLEYIGTNRQQMGDGGAIAQFINAATGEVLAVTGDDWACTVIHHAPSDTACARERNPVAGQGACAGDIQAAPTGWTAPGFDDSGWPRASTFSESAVRPKDGYDQISWTGAAALIWGPNLEQDNIVLCRAALGG